MRNENDAGRRGWAAGSSHPADLGVAQAAREAISRGWGWPWPRPLPRSEDRGRFRESWGYFLLLVAANCSAPSARLIRVESVRCAGGVRLRPGACRTRVEPADWRGQGGDHRHYEQRTTIPLWTPKPYTYKRAATTQRASAQVTQSQCV